MTSPAAAVSTSDLAGTVALQRYAQFIRVRFTHAVRPFHPSCWRMVKSVRCNKEDCAAWDAELLLIDIMTGQPRCLWKRPMLWLS